MLEILTFTGIDRHTDLERLAEMAERYPRAEFAVLVGTRTGQDDPQYPPLGTVWELRHRLPRTAIHLCGRYAREAAGAAPESSQLHDLCRGFGRVQVNLPGAPRRVGEEGRGVGEEGRRKHSLTVFAEKVDPETVILQHREAWSRIPLNDVRFEYLHDLSGGKGIECIDSWPDPPRHRRVGYAGGLGPQNICRALDFLERRPAANTWLDMQRGVRDQENRLDLGLVELVCRAALGT